MFPSTMTMFLQRNILFLTIPYILLKDCDAVKSWLGDGIILYKGCDASLAFSVTFGSSIEKCFLDCGHHSNCKAIMYYHRMKQCAFFDMNLYSFSFSSSGPTCSYVEVSNQNVQGCDPGEQFDVSIGECVVSECGEPNGIPNARLLSNTMKAGLFNRYLCKPGYYRVGNPKTQCQSDGTWTLSDFSCQPSHCQPPPNVENATIVQIGSTVLNSILNCSDITCQTSLAASASRVGSVAKYQCISDHVSSSTPEILCQQNGNWSTVNFSCIYHYCEIPQNIANATLQNINRTMLGGINRYICNEKYIGIGNPEIYCTLNGSWSNTDFYCVRVCSNPKNIIEADLATTQYSSNLSEYTVGTNLTYVCGNGYKGSQNTSEFMCTVNGWTPYFLNCCKDDTIGYGSLCYKSYTFDSLNDKSYYGAEQACLDEDLYLVTTTQDLYTMLENNGQPVSVVMLYANRKPKMYDDLVECLTLAMSKTAEEVEGIIGTSYKTAMANQSEYSSTNCTLALLNEWKESYPTDPSNECIATGSLFNNKYLDYDCNTQSQYIGFTCMYVPPVIEPFT